MSLWHLVKDIEDVELSEDKKTLEVLINSDRNGNNYIEIPIEFILIRLNELKPIPDTTEKELIK